MRITSAKTFTVGNPWKNWVFVRLETDEGVYGVGEGTANAFAETIATAIHELEDTYIGLDPTQVELLAERMHRDVYTDGGQIHRAALRRSRSPAGTSSARASASRCTRSWAAACATACASTRTAGTRSSARPRRWRRRRAASSRQGYTALKFDPFGAHLAHRRSRRGGARDRPHRGRPRRHRPGRRPAGRGPLPLRRRPGDPLRAAHGALEPALVRGAGAAPGSRLGGRGRAALPRADRDRRELRLAQELRRPAAPRRRAHLAARPDASRRPLADAQRDRDGGRLRHRGRAALGRRARSARPSACSSPPAARTSSSRSCSTSSTRAGRARSSTTTSRPTPTATSPCPTARGSASTSTGSGSREHPARRGNRIRLFERGWELRRSADD